MFCLFSLPQFVAAGYLIFKFGFSRLIVCAFIMVSSAFFHSYLTPPIWGIAETWLIPELFVAGRLAVAGALEEVARCILVYLTIRAVENIRLLDMVLMLAVVYGMSENLTALNALFYAAYAAISGGALHNNVLVAMDWHAAMMIGISQNFRILIHGILLAAGGYAVLSGKYSGFVLAVFLHAVMNFMLGVIPDKIADRHLESVVGVHALVSTVVLYLALRAYVPVPVFRHPFTSDGVDRAT